MSLVTLPQVNYASQIADDVNSRFHSLTIDDEAILTNHIIWMQALPRSEWQTCNVEAIE